MTEKDQPHIMSLAEKLMAIQTELKAPKGQYNSFGKYKYRSAEDILEAVKPLFERYRVLVVLKDEVEVMGNEHSIVKSKDGETETLTVRTYIRATATIYDLDSNMNVSTTAYARESDKKSGMDASQITGTASSYARKYALNGLFCIDDTKDADTNEYHEQVNKKKTVEDYMKLIDDCETEQGVNTLFYEWSKVYPKGTPDYTKLTKKSFDRKNQITGA